MSVRGRPVQDAHGEAARAVRLPLLRVPAANGLRVRHLRYIPELRAPRGRAAVMLHVSRSPPPGFFFSPPLFFGPSPLTYLINYIVTR